MSRASKVGGATLLLLLALSWLGVGSPAVAQIEPTAKVLVPYFAVDLDNPFAGEATLFAVSHHDGLQSAEVVFTVHTNWGIPVLETRHTMQPNEVVTVNLRDWIVKGKLLDRDLGPAEIEKLQAQLSGLPAPDNHLYYGSAIAERLAVGYVTIGHAAGIQHSLWGDFFSLNPKLGVFQGDTLVNIDPTSGWNLPCKTLGVRFLEGAAFDQGTHLVIWSPKEASPSDKPELPNNAQLVVVVKVYDEPGNLIEERVLTLLPDQVVKLADLVPRLPPQFGWLELALDTAGFVGADFNLHNATSAALHAYCLPLDEHPIGPRVDLQKMVNGLDADVAPGAKVPVGSSLLWTFIVTNNGSVPLTDLVVKDEGNVITCPENALDPGASFTCTLSGTADVCQHENVATVTGNSAQGPVEASDPAHYFGQAELSIAILSVTAGGHDASSANGPYFGPGDTFTWQWRVKNTGGSELTGVTLTSSTPAQPTCPKSTLAPDEEMLCTASEGPVALGTHSKEVSVTGTGPCPGDEARASKIGYYQVTQHPPEPFVGITLTKLVNGDDANTPPGPEVPVGSTVNFTYVVTNISSGDPTPMPLSAITVVDDKGVLVTCPKTVLEPGESMTCSGSGIAIAGQYTNHATATGSPPVGDPVSATDPANYFGRTPPGGQGCSPGYWKNHLDSWPPTGYSTGQHVDTVFPAVDTFYASLGDVSLIDALSFQGGPGPMGAAQILLRAAVAAVLNASHPGVTGYPLTPAQVIANVDTALLGTRETMLTLAASLDADNNLGCPLN